MPEPIEVHPDTKKWHQGWKGLTGAAIVVITALAHFLGYDTRELFPVEIARFGTEFIILAGGILAFVGRWFANGEPVMKRWFKKR